MTISSENRKAGPYIGAGSSTTFPFAFKVFQSSDLEVVRLAVSTGVETALTLSSDYTVTLNSDQDATPGGNVVLSSALAIGYNLVITSSVASLQETDLTNNGGFYPEVITTALDRLTIIAQQLQTDVDRSAKLPITSTADANTLSANISRLASSADNIDTVSGAIANINTVSGDLENIDAVGGSISSVNAVANDLSAINAVNDDLANIDAVNANKSHVDAVAANISSVNSVSSNLSAILLAIGSSSGLNAHITGTATIYVNQTITFTISDYDSFATYSVSVSAGSVSRNGDSITFTAPSTVQTVSLTLTVSGNSRVISVPILSAGVATPSITSPTTGATNQLATESVTASAFSWVGVSDTHLNSDWELSTNSGFTGVVQSSYADATNKTSWSVTGLSVSTTYYLRTRQHGTANGWSAWSTGVSFTTASSFNSYISTPNATPGSFGASFEGGYYAGKMWEELVESSTSTAIGTGTKTFTVPDMTSTPIVYSGQSLEVRSRANPANKMIGTVTGALSTTLTLSISSVGGSGTFTDWSVMATYRIIDAPKSSGENSAIAIKNANTALPTACQTLTEGWKGTLAMVAADNSTVYPAAWWARGLSIGGYTDWYVPARDELELSWRNLKPTADANYASADRPTGATPSYMNLGSLGDTANTHGLNNNSNPTGAAYTTGSPAQVAAGIGFRTGETNAFAYGSYYYWSCSEYSTTLAWLQVWYSGNPGLQSSNGKTNAYYVRAVRRSII